jgi:hypothetical protein
MSDHPKNQSYQHHAAGLTPGERRVAHGLDRLGDAMRSRPDAGLEDRLFEASRGHLPSPVPLNHPGIFGAGRLLSPARLALAASVAIVGTAVWLATQPMSPSPEVAPAGEVAIAELQAEVGFTLDALLASYDVPVSGSGSGAPSSDDSFWDSDAELFASLDTEISL